MVEREYLAEVEGDIDEAALRKRLAEGVETIEEGAPLVVTADLLGVDGQTVRLVVTEGKYRMVRRVLANTGHPVVALQRVRYGAVELDDLEISEGEAAPIEPPITAPPTSAASPRAPPAGCGSRAWRRHSPRCTGWGSSTTTCVFPASIQGPLGHPTPPPATCP